MSSPVLDEFFVPFCPFISHPHYEYSQTEYAYRKYFYCYYEPRNQSQMGSFQTVRRTENFILIEDLAKSEADMKEIGASDRICRILLPGNHHY